MEESLQEQLFIDTGILTVNAKVEASFDFSIFSMEKQKEKKCPKKEILCLLILLMSTILSFAQIMETKYYNNRWLQKEVPQTKAEVSRELIRNPDSSVTTLIKNIKSNKVLNSETYKGDEPSGVWTYPIGGGMREKDYDFLLVYADSDCANAPELKNITNYFEDNSAIGYQAPKIATGEKSIYQFLAKVLEYPPKARENNVMGRVLTSFTISKEGSISNLAINKGVYVELDKEAIRVLRKLKLSGPAMLNDEPVGICVKLPLMFQLQK